MITKGKNDPIELFRGSSKGMLKVLLEERKKERKKEFEALKTILPQIPLPYKLKK